MIVYYWRLILESELELREKLQKLYEQDSQV